MVSRSGTYGIFWGCKSFPDCRGTRDNMGRSKTERELERKNRAKHEDYEFDDKDVTNRFSFKRTR